MFKAVDKWLILEETKPVHAVGGTFVKIFKMRSCLLQI